MKRFDNIPNSHFDRNPENEENKNLVKQEFEQLKSYFDELRTFFSNEFKIISMGMSGDYKEAIEAGSNMVRIGSSLFGRR